MRSAAGLLDNDYPCGIRRLVAERNPQPKREQDRKQEDPEDNLGLAE